MTASHTFCSESARRRAETIYGTASRVRKWMLLEYPGVWRSSAIEGSSLPDHVKKKLADLCISTPGLRQVFVRQTHRRSDRMRCFVMDSPESPSGMFQLDLSVCDEVDAFDFSAIASHPRAERIDGPLFMVCTHGNHDKCCAKFGIPVYEKLKHVAGDRAWQCSHIGGDRFAGNMICLPHGVYYGNVTPNDVPVIVDAYRRGEIYLEKYRGRCCYPKAVQVADYFLRQQSGRLRLNDFAYESSHRGEACGVRFTSSDGVHEVTFRSRHAFDELLTCKAGQVNPITQYELISYRPPAAMSV